MLANKVTSLLVLFVGSTFALAHGGAQLAPQPTAHLTPREPALEHGDAHHYNGMFPLVEPGGLASRSLMGDKSAFIRGQIDRIKGKTTELDAALTHWNGTVVDAVQVRAASDALVATVKDSAAQVTAKSPKLGIPAALRLRGPVEEMVKLTEATVNHYVEQQKRFRDLGLHGEVKAGLEGQKQASQVMIDATVAKVPRIGRKKARKALEVLKEIFDKGIKAYN